MILDWQNAGTGYFAEAITGDSNTFIFGHIGSIHSSRVLLLLGKDMVIATKLETQGSTAG